MRYARDVAKGMVWLHEAKPPTIHRDLKPANILIDFHDQVKISDFGILIHPFFLCLFLFFNRSCTTQDSGYNERRATRIM